MATNVLRSLPFLLGFLLGLLLVASAIVWASCARSSRTNPETEPLVVAAAELDLGTQYETPVFHHRFHIRNVSNAPVTVQRLESTCDCLRLSPGGPFTIDGGAQAVDVTVALKINSPCQRSRGIDQPLSIPIRAHVAESGNAIRVVEWNLTCSAKAAFRIVSGSASFGLQSVEQLHLTREFIVELGPDVRSVECSGSDRWTFSLPKELNNPERRYTGRLSAKMPLKLGTMNEMLILTPINRNGDRLPEAVLRIEGECVEDLISEPRQLVFGRRQVGAVVEEVFSIRSLTGRAVESLRITSPDADFQQLTDGPDSTKRFLIKQRIATIGDHPSTIFATYTSMDNIERVASIGIRYFGEAPKGSGK